MHSNDVKLRPRLMITADNMRTKLLRSYPVTNFTPKTNSSGFRGFCIACYVTSSISDDTRNVAVNEVKNTETTQGT